MSSTNLKILVVLLIFLGESLAIYAEMIAARTKLLTSQTILQVFLKTFLIIIIAGAFLILGYILGFSKFKNIWIVSITSITSILIVEPILAYTIFHQLPTRGAVLGFIFGTLGFLVALFIK